MQPGSPLRMGGKNWAGPVFCVVLFSSLFSSVLGKPPQSPPYPPFGKTQGVLHLSFLTDSLEGQRWPTAVCNDGTPGEHYFLHL